MARQHVRPDQMTYKNKSIDCCSECEAAAEIEDATRQVFWEAVDIEGIAHVCTGSQGEPMMCGQSADVDWWWAV